MRTRHDTSDAFPPPGAAGRSERWDYARCTCAGVEWFGDMDAENATAEAMRRLRARLAHRFSSASLWFPRGPAQRR